MEDCDLAVICANDLDKFSQNSIDVNIDAVYTSRSKKIEKTFKAKAINIDGFNFLCIDRRVIGLYPGKKSYEPHEIDYKTMMVGLHQRGIRRVISTSAVGTLEKNWAPGTLVLISDYIDLINRDITLDDIGPDYADMSRPFDPELNKVVEKAASQTGKKLEKDGVYVMGIKGARFETPAEIDLIRNMLKRKLVVGMTIPTEAQLARLLNMKYSSIAIVTNYAAGMGKPISHKENEAIVGNKFLDIFKIVENTITNLFPQVKK